MQRLTIERTRSTLAVDFDPQGVLRMHGESYPENSLKFFQPVLTWLEEFLAAAGPDRPLRADLDIVYFNSSSSKALMNFFDMLDEAARGGAPVTVVWRYHEENEIARECGEEFAEDMEAVCFEMAPYGDGGANGA
ncbi:MAG: DUF1987 domain-containing protein [Desulfovibrionaceae bacterium]|jgi:hypothetical protein|nr:DUF1987 domain-containing protein [Desulfovibrionaceae bacterium]